MCISNQKLASTYLWITTVHVYVHIYIYIYQNIICHPINNYGMYPRAVAEITASLSSEWFHRGKTDKD